jgi:hypothetical protein
MLLAANDKHGIAGMAHDSVGHAFKDVTRSPRPAVGAHGYEIVGRFSGESCDFFCAISKIDYRRDIFQTVLFDLFDFFAS